MRNNTLIKVLDYARNYTMCHFDGNERSEWNGEISQRGIIMNKTLSTFDRMIQNVDFEKGYEEFLLSEKINKTLQNLKS